MPGTRELCAELGQVLRGTDADRRWQEQKRIFAAIRQLADPRGADELARLVAEEASAPADAEKVFRRTQAAFALAELGDSRALPALAARLEHDPLVLYHEDDPNQLELRRSDQERILAARLIGELALLHPDELEAMRTIATAPLRRWLSESPMPHANGLRALARLKSEDEAFRRELRAWADPPGALPKLGALPPFEDKWVIATSALRYLGALRDPKAFTLLQKQLTRKPKTFDASMDALMAGGRAMLGMSVRALSMGAADGFAELGDARAAPHLLKHVEDSRQNESSRTEACRALAQVLDATAEREIVTRLGKWRSGKQSFEVGCLLETLARHPIPAATPRLLELAERAPQELALAAAIALGHSALDSSTEDVLVKRLAEASTRSGAALALLLGGSSEGVARALAAYPENEARALETLASDYDKGVGSLGSVPLPTLFRWVRNARSAARGSPWDFARKSLEKALANLTYDSGPGSTTVVVLRRRLFELARLGTADERASAIDTLELARERGVLLSLAEGTGPSAERAAQVARGLAPSEP